MPRHHRIKKGIREIVPTVDNSPRATNIAKVLALLIFALTSINLPFPRPALATRCDCKPEFEVYAEADGVCEVTRDDKKWCEIRFNSSTGTGTRQQEFFQTLSRLEVKVFDNFKAAQEFNRVEPEKWNKDFIEQYLTSLLAVALWEKAPERIRPILQSVRNASARILPLITTGPKKVEQLSLERYKATISRGCIDLDDGVFAVMIKTRFAESNQRCNFGSGR